MEFKKEEKRKQAIVKIIFNNINNNNKIEKHKSRFNIKYQYLIEFVKMAGSRLRLTG